LTHYEVLDIPKNAGIKQIKSAFRKKAMLFHPDKREGSVTKFHALRKAYEILSDPAKRRQYDLSLQTKVSSLNKKKHPAFRKSHAATEASRQAYYDAYIRPKQQPTSSAGTSSKQPASAYKEYKYFIWAGIITLLLALLLAMLSPLTEPLPVKKHRIFLKEGMNPYVDVFKTATSQGNDTIKIINETPQDVVVFILSPERLNCCFTLPALTAARSIPIDSKGVKCIVSTGNAFSSHALNTNWPGFTLNAKFFLFQNCIMPENLITFKQSNFFKPIGPTEFITMLKPYEF